MKKDIFNMLENAGDDDMKRLMDLTPGFDERTAERLLEMSERKYDTKKNNAAGNTAGYETEISGVETYSRPMWKRLMPVAASLVIVAGAIGMAGHLLKGSDPVEPDVSDPPVIAASTEDPSAPAATAEETAEAIVTAVPGTDTTAETAETAPAATETAAVATVIGQGSGAAATAAVQAATAYDTTKAAGTSAVTPSAPETPVEMIDRLGREGYTEDPEYTAIAKDTLTRAANNYRVCCAPEYRCFDFSDSFEITYNAPGMDGPSERTVTFVRYNDPDFSSYEEMYDNLIRTVSKDPEIFVNNISNQVTPGCYIDCTKQELCPTTIEYNGKLYADPEKSPDNPENRQLLFPYMKYCLDKPILIEHEDDESFSAWVLHENWNYGKTPYTADNEYPYYVEHVYFRQNNGVWGVYECWVTTFDEYVNAMMEHIGTTGQ